MQNKIGYCPWCGSEIGASSMSVQLEEIYWERCNAPFACRGAVTFITTDMQGFVLYPQNKKGMYIYSRNHNVKRNAKR